MRTIQTILIILAMIFIASCSGGSGNPVEPTNINETLQTTQEDSNRHFWGFWTLSLSEELQTVEAVPFRNVDMHFNLIKILENGCTTCLTIDNFQIIDQNNWVFDLKLSHPFPGMPQYTGFDVRGIFITNADYEFPVNGRKIVWGDNLPQIMNNDGYTSLFNPTEFPETIPECLGYIQGKYSNTNDLAATLNPFVVYNRDMPRRMFEIGSVVSQNIHLYKPVGPIQIGYAVDVSWVPPTNDPVTDPVNDFPSEANCMEAYRIEVDIEDIECSWFDVGDSVLIKVEVFDHQGVGTITEVFVEAPDIFTGIVELDFHEITGNGGALFKGSLTNEFADVPDEYPLIVMVFDSESDPNLGFIQAWELYPISVGIETGWARTWGGLLLPNEEYESARSVIDSNGNIYVGGHFEGTVDFDPGTESEEVDEHYSNGYSDNFLSKFDECGNFLWTFTFGGTGLDILSSVALDTDDKIYLTGYFQHTVDFDRLDDARSRDPSAEMRGVVGRAGRVAAEGQSLQLKADLLQGDLARRIHAQVQIAQAVVNPTDAAQLET